MPSKIWQNVGDALSYDLNNVTASRRVYQILLDKSYILSTSKKICQVKKEYLQQFSIIHLPNPDLTYIRNPERETKLYYALPPLENLNQESFCVIYFFFHPPT